LPIFFDSANISTDGSVSNDAYHAPGTFDIPEPAANVDANAPQDLSQGPTANALEVATESMPLDDPEAAFETAQPSIEFDSRFSDASSVVVELFPFGNPGAPISDGVQGPSSYGRDQAAQGDSIWAPFQSKRDWEIAEWLKMQGASSSSVAKFLGISDVCFRDFHRLF
jgi:hypothetical protein